MIRAQVSLYPTEREDSDTTINQSIQALSHTGIEYSVGPVSTELIGEPSQVWQSLQEMFREAMSSGGEVSMVCTLTTSKP